MAQIHTATLKCGMPLIVESMSGVRSLGLTWLLPAGSSRDPAERLGLCAMFEELLLRGAANLDSREQADAFDRLGVSRGTGTETFYLSISATMLGSRLRETLPLIVDMIRRPRFDASAIEPARDLCIQAVESLADDPPERLGVLVKQRHNPEPVNRSALGSIEGLKAISASELGPLWKQRAVPVGSALCLAGDVDAREAQSILDPLLSGWTGAAAPVPTTGTPPRGYHHEQDDTNQVHIGLAYDAPSERDPDCWPERIATSVLSGGSSCRLFTEVREKRGLCYSVHASYAADATFGRTTGYVGTTPEKAQESLDVMLAELRRIRTPEGAVTNDEFERARIGMKSKLVMRGESTSARASALAHDWHKLGRARPLEELTRTIDAVSLEQVNQRLSRSGLGRMTIATVGPAPLVAPDLSGS